MRDVSEDRGCWRKGGRQTFELVFADVDGCGRVGDAGGEIVHHGGECEGTEGRRDRVTLGLREVEISKVEERWLLNGTAIIWRRNAGRSDFNHNDGKALVKSLLRIESSFANTMCSTENASESSSKLVLQITLDISSISWPESVYYIVHLCESKLPPICP